MKFTEITSELAANKKGADIIVVYEAGDKTYFMGSVITNHGLSEDEVLDLIGWDDETMTEAVEKIGWDGYDYDAIAIVWNPEEYLTEKGFLPASEQDEDAIASTVSAVVKETAALFDSLKGEPNEKS